MEFVKALKFNLQHCNLKYLYNLSYFIIFLIWSCTLDKYWSVLPSLVRV